MNRYTLKPCSGCPPEGFDHDLCNLYFIIYFSWPGGVDNSDLDTAVSANDATSGFGCDVVGNPFFVSGDQIEGQDLVEEHHISINLADIQNDNPKLIELFMHWHLAVPEPNQLVNIVVKEGGLEAKIENIQTNRAASGCSVTQGEKQGQIEIQADGSWELKPE